MSSLGHKAISKRSNSAAIPNAAECQLMQKMIFHQPLSVISLPFILDCLIMEMTVLPDLFLQPQKGPLQLRR